MPGNLGRSLSEMVTIALMVVGASIGVIFAVGANVVLGIILVALGAAVGLLIGRLLAPAIDRSQTKRPPLVSRWPSVSGAEARSLQS